MTLSFSVRAAIAKYHRLGGLSVRNTDFCLCLVNVLLTVIEAGSPRSGASKVPVRVADFSGPYRVERAGKLGGLS